MPIDKNHRFARPDGLTICWQYGRYMQAIHRMIELQFSWKFDKIWRRCAVPFKRELLERTVTNSLLAKGSLLAHWKSEDVRIIMMISYAVALSGTVWNRWSRALRWRFGEILYQKFSPSRLKSYGVDMQLCRWRFRIWTSDLPLFRSPNFTEALIQKLGFRVSESFQKGGPYSFLMFLKWSTSRRLPW